MTPQPSHTADRLPGRAAAATARRARAPMLVLTVTLALTIGATWYVAKTTRDRDWMRHQLTLQASSRRIQDAIDARVQTYITVLRGTAGLFNARGDVSREEFSAYVRRMGVGYNYRGLQGIGFARRASDDDEDKFPIAYLEAPDRRGLPQVGTDLFDDPVRRPALESARDTGLPRVSGRARPKPEADADGQSKAQPQPVQPPPSSTTSDFLVCVPIYRNVSAPRTIPERRRETVGFVFGPFRAGDLLADVAADLSRSADTLIVTFAVYDGAEPAKSQELYRWAPPEPPELRSLSDGIRADVTPTSESVPIAGQTWTLVFYPRSRFAPGTGILAGLFVLIGGSVVSVVLFLVTSSQVRARRSAEENAAGLRRSEQRLRDNEGRLRRAVEALAESEQRFRNLADTAPMLIWTEDAEGRRTYFNKPWLDFIGRSDELKRPQHVNHLPQPPRPQEPPPPHPPHQAGDEWTLSIHPEDRHRWLQTYDNARVTHRRFEIECRLRRNDGQYRSVLIYVSPRFTPDGQFAGFVGIGIDNTSRKQAEDELRYQSHLTNTITSYAAEALFLMDGQGRITYMNAAAEQTFGWKQDELAGKVLHDVIHGRRPDGSHYPTGDCPLFSVFTIGKPLRNHEDVFYRKDGVAVPVACSNAPILADGKVVAAVLVAHDITDRKRAEDERSKLLAAEQAARAESDAARADSDAARAYAEAARGAAAFLAEASAVLASSLDFETTLSQVARLCVPALADWCFMDILEEGGGGQARRLAIAHADPAKAPLRDDVARYAPRPGWDSPQALVLRSGNPIVMSEVTEQGVRRDLARDPEHARVLLATGFRSALVVPLGTRGRWFGALTFLAGESGRRYREEDLPLALELARRVAIAVENARLYGEAERARVDAEAANRTKDEFLATLSHELRTPLNAILGWAQLLRMGAIDGEEVKQGLDTIERNAKVQAQLVDDLLDLSRIISGKLRLDVKSVDPGSVIAASLETVQPAAEAKGIRVMPVLDNRTGPVLGDAARLQQVVWNLLSNAIKFTGRGGQVQVLLRRVEDQAEVTISDTGQGISPEFLPHVFERLRQADATSTRRHGGLGLGLAIVRHLVELHGGSVRAESRGLGKGAAFTVMLPLMAPSTATGGASHRPPALVDDRAAGRAASLTGLKVLVVDDEPDARELIGRVLRHAGADVASAGSAAEAMDLLREGRPDVLVSDIGMPDEDGYMLIRRIRSLDALQGGQVPAIALTAFARGEDRRRALEAGFQSHVPKPVEADQLAAVVARLAGRTNGNGTKT